MGTSLNRLPTAGSPGRDRLERLINGLVSGLPSSVRREVTPLKSDSEGVLEEKWQRASTEAIGELRELAAREGYIHRQDKAAAEWIIVHRLNAFPAVAVVDSANRIVYGEVEYLDRMRCAVRFSGATTGRAYCR